MTSALDRPRRRRPRSDSGPWYPIERRWQCVRQFDGAPKHDYGDERTAWFAADAMTAEFGPERGERWVPYVCGRCKGWHVGRPARYDRRDNLRHYDAWEAELGDRVEACMRAENQGGPSRRRTVIASLCAAAVRKARLAA